MTDDSQYRGGAANTPPFPSHGNQGVPDSTGAGAQPTEAGADSSGQTNASPAETRTAPDSDTISDGEAPALAPTETRPDVDPPETDYDAKGRRPYAELPPEEDDLVNDFTPDDDPDIASRGPEAVHRRGGHRSFRSLAMDELSRRGETAFLHGVERLADSLDESAHRIHRLAALRGGPDAVNFGPVTSTVGRLEGAAEYLRNTDLEGVRTDLRRRVRSRPVQTLGIALCVGWVAGRILR